MGSRRKSPFLSDSQDMKPEALRDLSDIFIFLKRRSERVLNTTVMKISNGCNICFWSKSANTNTNCHYREGISPLLAKKVKRKYCISILNPVPAIWSLAETGQGKPGFLISFQISVLRLLTGHKSGITSLLSGVLADSFIGPKTTLWTLNGKRGHFQNSAPDPRSCFSFLHICLLEVMLYLLTL